MWWYMPGNQSQQQVQHVFKTLDTQHNNHTKQKKKERKSWLLIFMDMKEEEIRTTSFKRKNISFQ